ncbi:hypothetical protein GCM10007977_069080 [Dactylosporangium sucinum]|uniref:Uncharacterized protein n=1 Tax=Dactylosporangium sucinum TaxID=1424081 RepID=A0A917U4E9_9ACTN|nr:hypothetical protein GCM10007977_069080 [Dactylosporangium sucinum]
MAVPGGVVPPLADCRQDRPAERAKPGNRASPPGRAWTRAGDRAADARSPESPRCGRQPFTEPVRPPTMWRSAKTKKPTAGIIEAAV